MANLTQISETQWVNLDLVTDIHFVEANENYHQDRLLFSFAATDADGCRDYVAAVDDWARKLYKQLLLRESTK